jgi:hypothetical protein
LEIAKQLINKNRLACYAHKRFPWAERTHAFLTIFQHNFNNDFAGHSYAKISQWENRGRGNIRQVYQPPSQDAIKTCIHDLDRQSEPVHQPVSSGDMSDEH